MPYHIKEENGSFNVVKEENGHEELVAHHSTREKAQAQIALLEGKEHGWHPSQKDSVYVVRARKEPSGDRNAKEGN